MSQLRGQAPQADLNTSVSCGVTINATLAVGSDCAAPACLGETITTGAGRIFRDGIPSECDPAKPCPGTFNTGVTFDYQIHEFNFDDEAGDECFCLDVDFNTGTCGVSVHGSTFAGIYATQAANLACTGTGPDGNPFEYIGDVGGSLTQPFSGPFTKVVNRAGAANASFVAHSNFGRLSGCNYSYTLNCAQAQSLGCLILPPLELIEEKLDDFECVEGVSGQASSLALVPTRTR
jgi:hypothetical protein